MTAPVKAYLEVNEETKQVTAYIKIGEPGLSETLIRKKYPDHTRFSKATVNVIVSQIAAQIAYAPDLEELVETLLRDNEWEEV